MSCPIHAVRNMKISPGTCPMHTNKTANMAGDWWPNQLNLTPLKKLKEDIFKLMKTSQSWWPADYGHYGPFFVRMSWHSAGTYRVFDGRGGGGTGMLRFAPLNSSRRLLWPIKKKYGRKLSWADLMILTGNCAMESMGFKTFGFGGGREDVYEPESEVYWGAERTWLSAERGGLGDALHKPLGAVQMGLIYVNPEGPNGVPNPLQSAEDIRTTFGRMAMNDVETVALIAGGHTFGKAHGAADPGVHVGPEPEGASIEEQGTGWKNSFQTGSGKDAITSGLEGAWTANPIQWDNGYFENLFGYEWELSESPAVPDAHVKEKRHPPIMFTTDLALIMDPKYKVISKRFHDNPEEFQLAFAKAWYKLTHRDLGPVNPQLWQDPIPMSNSVIGDSEIQELRTAVQSMLSGGSLSVSQLVKIAWGSASSFRHTDFRGGGNGARIRLAPQKNWEANDPDELQSVLEVLENVQNDFNNSHATNPVSIADLIVLAGSHEMVVPFRPGRGDATQEMTDVESFSYLEPTADGFPTPEAQLVDMAHLLTLSAAEMTVLVGGMRSLGANSGGSNVGILTDNPGILSNDFFVNLLNMGVQWGKDPENPDAAVAKQAGQVDPYRESGKIRWRASRVDLIFGSHSELRSFSEYYACDDSNKVFVEDFVKAWVKVMELDRFDV
eukprot:GSMAST32.ASY1.ANO1.2677.1 assembled CDS